MPIQCKIVSTDKTVFDGFADVVLLPTKQGQIGILQHHVRLFTELTRGIIAIKKDDNRTEFTVTGGFAEVTPEVIRILAEASENIDEIDEERVQKAKQRAEEALKTVPKGSPEFLAAVAKLKNVQLRTMAIKRRRRHPIFNNRDQ